MSAHILPQTAQTAIAIKDYADEQNLFSAAISEARHAARAKNL
jgi:hypothetical protein